MSREERFAAIYHREHAGVLRFLARRTTPTHAEDVAHDTFLVAWRRLDDVPVEPADARAWLFGVARHCLLNAQRSTSRRTALEVRIAAEASGVVPGHDDAAAARVDLATAWDALPAAHQEALALATWEDLTSAQAAQVLGISSAAYRIRLHRARAALRAALTPTPAAPAALAPEGAR